MFGNVQCVQFHFEFPIILFSLSEAKIGDVLFSENPYSSVLLPEHYASHCHHCYKSLLVAVPCLKCTQPRYCSETCRIRSWYLNLYKSSCWQRSNRFIRNFALPNSRVSISVPRFGEISPLKAKIKNFGNFERVLLVLGKFYLPLGKFSVLKTAKYYKNNQGISGHTGFNRGCKMPFKA